MKPFPSALLVLTLSLTLAGSGMAQADDSVQTSQAAPAAAQGQVEDQPAAPPAEAEPAPVSSPVAETPVLSERVLAAIGPQKEGTARVVFFRPSKFAGGAIGFIVREAETELGKLRSGNYFVVNAEPGKHTYTVHTEATDNTSLELEADETYFISGSISMGFLVGHPHLAATDAAAFETALPKLSPSKPLS